VKEEVSKTRSSWRGRKKSPHPGLIGHTKVLDLLLVQSHCRSSEAKYSPAEFMSWEIIRKESLLWHFL
jgi:hypothetical protein